MELAQPLAARHRISGSPDRSTAACLRRAGFIFAQAADVERGQRYLEHDQGPRSVVPPPCDPENVAAEKPPEAVLPAAFRLRSHEPRGQDTGHHGGPLQEIEDVHKVSASRRTADSWSRGRLQPIVSAGWQMAGVLIVDSRGCARVLQVEIHPMRSTVVDLWGNVLG